MTFADLTIGSPGRRVTTAFALSGIGLTLYGYGPLLLIAGFVAVPWIVGAGVLAGVLTVVAAGMEIGDCREPDHDDSEHGVGR